MADLEPKEVAQLRILAENYARTRPDAILGKELGHGASAAVFDLAVGEARRALKVYHPDFLVGSEGATERRRLKLQQALIGHNCPELVRITDVRVEEKTAYVEMEYSAGADLNQCLQSIPAELIQPLVSKLVRAVVFLESKGLVHRDIKPSNIRISPDFSTLKLLDLGVLRQLDDDDSVDATAHGGRKPFIATAQYSSPEYLFWLEQPRREFWRALSIYQVGAVLHDMLTRKALFADEVASGNRYVLAMAVLQKVPSISVPDALKRLAVLAGRCLTKDMARRLSLVEWAEFEEDSAKLASVARRIQQLKKVGLSPSTSAMNLHERTLRRNQMIETVMREIHAKMQESFSGCQLELAKRGDGTVLIFCLPKTSLVVDNCVEFRWFETSKEETAAVHVASEVRPSNKPSGDSKGTKDLGTLTLEGTEQTVNALFEHVAESIGLALDLAEANGGTLDKAISLSEHKK